MSHRAPNSLCMRINLALTAWLGLAAIASADITTSPIRQTGDWIAGCDNRADCIALGIANASPFREPRPGRQRLTVRISGDFAMPEGFRIEVLRLTAGAPSPAIRSRPVTLGFAGSDRSLDVTLAGERTTVPDEKAQGWLIALAQGTAFQVAAEDADSFEVPETSGFIGAWSWIAPRRAKALGEISARPLNTPARPRLRPAVEVMLSGLPAIQLLHTPCPEGRRLNGYRQFMLPGEALLWIVTCEGLGGVSTHFFQSMPKAAKALPLSLPDFDGTTIHAGADGLPDHVFDFDFGILRSRHGPDEQPDCGVQRAWGWDGKAWFLLERRDLSTCAGLYPSEWIRTYISP